MTFGDLLGRLDRLEIACPKCGRAGRYSVGRLALERRRDFKPPDWIADTTRDCPHNSSPGLADACGAPCPGLLKTG
jgi:hypothetical protein